MKISVKWIELEKKITLNEVTVTERPMVIAYIWILDIK